MAQPRLLQQKRAVTASGGWRRHLPWSACDLAKREGLPVVIHTSRSIAIKRVMRPPVLRSAVLRVFPLTVSRSSVFSRRRRFFLIAGPSRPVPKEKPQQVAGGKEIPVRQCHRRRRDAEQG